MSDYTLWTHGVSVEVENVDGSRGLHIERTGFGAKIKQNRGTSNWFHLAIPTPTLWNGEDLRLCAASLRVDVNNDAVIKRLHVRESLEGDSGYCSKVCDSGEINITGQVTRLSLDHLGHVEGPLAICAYVEFEGEEGEIRFIGAGALFRSRG